MAGCCITYDLCSIVEMNDGDNKGLDPFVSEYRDIQGTLEYF